MLAQGLVVSDPAGPRGDRPLRGRQRDRDDDRRAEARRDRRGVRPAVRGRSRRRSSSARSRSTWRCRRHSRSLIAAAAPFVALGVRRRRAARADAGGGLPAGRVRAPGAHVDLLPADGLPAPAAAAGDRAGGDVRGHGAARGGGRGRVEPRDRAARRRTRRGRGGRCAVSPVPAAPPARPRDAARRYLRFSWPIFVSSAAMLVVLQGQVLAFDSGAGSRPPGSSRSPTRSPATPTAPTRSSRATIYPAICAVRDRSRRSRSCS